MRKVNENLEMFLTQAIGMRILHIIKTIDHIQTFTPVNVNIMLWKETVIYDNIPKVKESCVNAIIMSTNILHLGPKAFNAINE